MTTNEVQTILQRLAVIETELKAIREDVGDHGPKIERLQLVVAFVAGIAFSAGGTSVLSILL